MAYIDDVLSALGGELTTIEAMGPRPLNQIVISASQGAGAAGTSPLFLAPASADKAQTLDHTGLYSLGLWAVAAVAYLIAASYLSPRDTAALSLLIVLGALTVNQQFARANGTGTIFQTLGLQIGG